jgi:flavin-dependent dehydrogenase
MTTPRPDVLIIGGGPAGSTAARTLALAGARVQLLDRAAFPRNKPCGGAISMRALRRFPYLDQELARIPTRRLSRLAGDARGFVNGITAEGIYYAMVSGDAAARAAATGAPEVYRRLWRREMGAELRDAVLVQRYLLTTPGRIDAALAGARRAPELADLLIRYTMGEVSYFAARHRVLLRSPGLAVRLFLDAQPRRVEPGRHSRPQPDMRSRCSAGN